MQQGHKSERAQENLNDAKTLTILVSVLGSPLAVPGVPAQQIARRRAERRDESRKVDTVGVAPVLFPSAE